MLLVTGGAGFIGANFVAAALARGHDVVNLDKLTYAGGLANLAALPRGAQHIFMEGDICDGSAVRALLKRYHPRALVHFAAESHVDRSIAGPSAFVQTNIVGTACLLDEARAYWRSLPARQAEAFRFLHISTDEVFGSLGPQDAPFSETSPYAPNSPYAASKAAADHLVRAYHETYGLPTLTTHCSNNYGPYQLPEKLVPLAVRCALARQPIPVYGDGLQVRDWLHVADHCEGLFAALEKGTPGGVYNFGGAAERRNIDVVREICRLLDVLRPFKVGAGQQHDALIRFVDDRPGHDRRYAVDAGKAARELGWRPRTGFEDGLRSTVQWYVSHADWMLDASRRAA